MLFSGLNKPPCATSLQAACSRSCTDTSGKRHDSHVVQSDTSSSDSDTASETTALNVSAPDPARTDLEVVINLVRSETLPTSASSVASLANAKRISDASLRMQTSSHGNFQSLRKRHKMHPNAPCFARTVAWGCLDTRYDERANLKLASRIESAPRLQEDYCPLMSSIASPLGVGWRPSERPYQYVKLVWENCNTQWLEGTSARVGDVVNVETRSLHPAMSWAMWNSQIVSSVNTNHRTNSSSNTKPFLSSSPCTLPLPLVASPSALLQISPTERADLVMRNTYCSDACTDTCARRETEAHAILWPGRPQVF